MKRPSRLTWIRLALLGVAVACGLVFDSSRWGEGFEASVARDNRANTLKRRADFFERYAQDYDEDGYERTGPPKHGEWLSIYAESGQTFVEFRMMARRKSEQRQVIVLQPYRPMDARGQGVLEDVRLFSEAFFSAPARLADPMDLPEDTYNASRGQYFGNVLLDRLQASMPADALVHAGVGDRDLYASATANFVFGVSDLSGGVGVYSFHRFGREGVSDALYLSRCLKLLNHEIGHSLGLKHCIYYRCAMNGCNSLTESDGAPVHYCPVCLRKLADSLGFEVLPRYRALAEFYASRGLKAEAEWVRARIAHLTEKGAATPWLPGR